MNVNKVFASAIGLGLVIGACTEVVADEKHHEDPTKIITRAGANFDSDGVGIRGSIGLDDTRMVNGSIKGNGDWRVGGSWLTDYGILNFNLDGNEDRRSYSIGTFVPMDVFGVDTGEWMIFPMAGVNYTQALAEDDSAYGGYIGTFAMRPINDDFTFMAYGGHTMGKYDALWAGSGLSYKIDSQQSVRVLGQVTDDKWDTDWKASISYNYEF